MSWSRRNRYDFFLFSQNNPFSWAKRTHFERNWAMSLTSVAINDSVKQRVSFLPCPLARIALIWRGAIKRSVSFASRTFNFFLINDTFLYSKHRLLNIDINCDSDIFPFSIQNLIFSFWFFFIHKVSKVIFKIIKVLKPRFTSLRWFLLFLFSLLSLLVMPSLVPCHCHIIEQISIILLPAFLIAQSLKR